MNDRTVRRVLSFACCAVLFCCTSSCISSCKRRNNSQANNNTQAGGGVTTPPFATKEPSRYRAVRTITSISGSNQPVITRTLISRDGPKRREEYDSASGEKIVYLATPAGTFVLLPSSNVLAAVNDAVPDELQPQTAESDLTADRLLNEISVDTRYQTVGPETLNGRATTKYRVITTSQTKGTSPGSETLIWIDDALGMPTRWETKTTTAGVQAETRMELSEINLDVEPAAFELPKDYRKANIAEVLGLIQGRKKQEAPKTVKN